MTQSSISDNEDYLGVIKRILADKTVFDNFKRQSSYNQILEHVSYELGQQYIDTIERDNPGLLNIIDLFRQNDLIGNANVCDYPIVKQISPSTLRYVKVLSDIIKLGIDLTEKDVVEIGGGYGGQCLILSKYFKFRSYTIIDLPEPLLLSDKYLKLNGISNVLFKDISELGKDTNYDYCVSNYAFSECSKEIQDEYLEAVINRSKNGYMTLNFISHIFSLESYSSNELLEKITSSYLIDEEPRSHGSNTILIW